MQKSLQVTADVFRISKDVLRKRIVVFNLLSQSRNVFGRLSIVLVWKMFSKLCIVMWECFVSILAKIWPKNSGQNISLPGKRVSGSPSKC